MILKLFQQRQNMAMFHLLYCFADHFSYEIPKAIGLLSFFLLFLRYSLLCLSLFCRFDMLYRACTRFLTAAFVWSFRFLTIAALLCLQAVWLL